MSSSTKRKRSPSTSYSASDDASRSPTPSNPSVATSIGGSYKANSDSEVDEKPKKKKTRSQASLKAQASPRAKVKARSSNLGGVKGEEDGGYLDDAMKKVGGGSGARGTQAWSGEDIQRLFELTYAEIPRHNWKEIATHFPGRSVASVSLTFGRQVRPKVGKMFLK